MSHALTHPLAEIADTGALPITAPASLATGTPDTHAQTLFEVFANPLDGIGKVHTVLACLKLTCDEFNDRLKTAVQMAAHADAFAGFITPVGAKGTDKYGPKQKSMSVQVSSIRKVFGAAKQFGTMFDLDDVTYDLQSMGITNATKACASVLKAVGKDWTGKAAVTDEQKQVNQKSAEFAQALAMLQADPANAGKSIADLVSSDAMETTVAKLEADALSKAADKLVAAWLKSQDARTVVLAATRFIAQYATDDELASAAQSIVEAQ
jgi:uncharacterized protein YukE